MPGFIRFATLAAEARGGQISELIYSRVAPPLVLMPKSCAKATIIQLFVTGWIRSI